MRPAALPLRWARFAPLMLLLAACSDRLPTIAPPALPTPAGNGMAALTCTAHVADRSVRCASDPGASAARRLIIGGQNVYVKLSSSNLSYDTATADFHFDVVVQNLMAQPIGTVDGFNPTGVKVVFHSGPTVTAGTGEITVDSAAAGTFTAADQPYYEYPELLYTGQESSPQTWWLTVPTTVETFTFLLYVAADIPAEPGLLRYVRESGTPTTDNLRAVWGTSGSNVYAAGGFTVLRYDGTRWKTELCGCFGPFFGMWGFGASDIIVVGDAGTILHYDGASWVDQSDTTFVNLRGVWGASPGSVWAVGMGGAILHYDGSNWTVPELEVAFSYNFNAVMGTSANDVWAVGAAGRMIQNENEEGWFEVTRVTTNALFDLWATGASSMWAVGNNGTVLHYDGTTWTVTSSGLTANLRAVWGASDSDLWASAVNGEMFHYDGVSWTPVPSGTTRNLHGLWGSGASDVFAVGESGAAIHWDGGEWEWETSNLRAVWGTGPTNLWVVGFEGSIMRGNGSTWVQEASGTAENLRGVWGTSTSDVFAVGLGGTILHRDGVGWSAMSSPTSTALHGVDGVASDTVFAVGLGGEILRYNGASWSAMSSPTVEDLHGVWANNGSDVWAVGAAGTVLHFDGVAWSQDSTGVSEDLNAVFGLPGGAEVWAVGAFGTVLHRTGGVWVDETLGGFHLQAVWASAANDVFAMGDWGFILHYNGTGWSLQGADAPYSNLTGIWGTSPTSVWVTGQSGTIFRGRR